MFRVGALRSFRAGTRVPPVLDIEQTIHALILGICGALLLCVAMPVYIARHVGPGKMPPLPQGRISTAGFGLGDVLGVMFFLILYAGALVGETPELTRATLLVVADSQAAFAIVVVAILFWRVDLMQAWGVRWRHWLLGLAAIPVVIVMYAFMYLLEVTQYNAWVAGLVEGDPTQEMVKVLQEANDPVILGLTALVAVIGAPLSEEIIFRGYIYPVVTRLLGMKFSVVFSAALFAAVHLNLHALLPLFLLGIILAVSYEMTGSLWMPIAIHMAFNGATVVLNQLRRIRPELFEEAGEAALLWPG